MLKLYCLSNIHKPGNTMRLIAVDNKSGNFGQLKSLINNQFPNVSFTYEKENNKQLAFLDVLIVRIDNR